MLLNTSPALHATPAPLRVGLVAPTMAILGGHAVQAERLLAAWHDDTEVEVQLIPINPPLPRWLARVSDVRYARTLITQLRYWPSLLRNVRGLDALHVFCTSNGSFYLSALPALLVAWLYRVPLIANYHGDATMHLRSSATVRQLLRRAAVNVAPSGYFAEVFREVGIDAIVVSNFGDVKHFRYRARNPLRPRLISTRNLEPIYNVACTLRAFAVVQQQHPEASLLVVGYGSEAGALRVLARELGLRNVTFVGRVPHADMPRHYDAHDVYVQTPMVDNFPGSVVEAFACGLPVVSTKVGGVPWILEHGTHGLLAPKNDHLAIANSILALIADPALAHRLAMAARDSCLRFAAPVVRETWREVYRNATSQPISRSAGPDLAARCERRPIHMRGAASIGCSEPKF